MISSVLYLQKLPRVELSCTVFLGLLSQWASRWPSFPSYTVSWDEASQCEKKGKGAGIERMRGKQEKPTICGTLWILLVVLVKPAGNAFPCGRPGDEILGFTKGSACQSGGNVCDCLSLSSCISLSLILSLTLSYTHFV